MVGSAKWDSPTEQWYGLGRLWALQLPPSLGIKGVVKQYVVKASHHPMPSAVGRVDDDDDSKQGLVK